MQSAARGAPVMRNRPPPRNLSSSRLSLRRARKPVGDAKRKECEPTESDGADLQHPHQSGDCDTRSPTRELTPRHLSPPYLWRDQSNISTKGETRRFERTFLEISPIQDGHNTTAFAAAPALATEPASRVFVRRSVAPSI